MVDWEAHPLLHVGGVALVNAEDPSALVSLRLRYSVSDNVKALVGGYLGLGDLPAMIAPRSEYGLHPAFFFVELSGRAAPPAPVHAWCRFLLLGLWARRG